MKSVCLFLIGASLLICAQSASVSISDAETRDLEELKRLLDSERTSRHHGGGGSGSGSGGSGSGGGGGRRKLEELATILTLCFDYEINNGGSGSGSGSGFDLMFTVTDGPSLFYFMQGCIDYFKSYNSSDGGSGVSATSGSGSGIVARELAFHSYLSSRGNSGPHPPPGSGSGLPPTGSGSGSGMTQRALFQLIDRYLAEKGLGGTGSGSGHPPPPGNPPPAKKRGLEFLEVLMKELE